MDKVQMVCTRRTVITQDGTLVRGQVFWCSPQMADHYIENNIARYAQREPQGPAEIKPQEPQEIKKSSPDPQAGRETDSAASSGIAGEGALRSASRPDQASQRNKPNRFTLGLSRTHKPRE